MTNYVMVPVPEEHVLEIMQRVVRLAQQASMEDWDEESVAEIWEASDEVTRSLLSFVARNVLMGKPLTDVAAADAIQLSLREAASVMRDVNETSKDMSRPSMLMLKATSETLPNGRTVDLRHFVMSEDTAKHIRSVERAQFEQDPHPLMDDER
ncbi:MAG: hypothetical protein KDB04_13275 [Acidimicrobiales bacterium]|mgnify:CR=1 FL=1|nr:hypothetical protein [Acidimicrobiales bacterium]HRW38506.1 hypothetical protein [Aquihabitans sp.]